MNQEVESFLHQINFPYTVGYGATETAPIMCYSDWQTFVQGSCGRPVIHMQLRIVSPDPEHIPGEILAKGLNVMLGYYKDPETTKKTIDKDGWYHTGDLGTMDAEGNLFIKGRSKTMLLGSNGQNIYPEEIEDKLDSLSLVSECLVIQDDQKLIGLVYPDYDTVKSLGLSGDDLKNILEQDRQELNTQMPVYSKIAEIRIQKEEFQKTPKKSIKRYLYEK